MGTYGNGPGSKRIPRLMAESELPEIYMSDGNPISDEPEEIKGRGARERTRVKYDDGLTEEQWLQAVDDDEDSPEAAAARKQARKERRENNRLKRAGELPGSIENSPAGSRDSTEEPEPEPTPKKGRGRKPGKVEKRKADDLDDEPPAKRRRGPTGRPSKGGASNDSMTPKHRSTLQASLRKVYDAVMKITVVVQSESDESDEEGPSDENKGPYVLVGPFVSLPSKKAFPDYYGIIKEPIALKTMEKKINKEEYSSLGDLLRDVRLMVSNAKTYNEEASAICIDAVKIQDEIREHPELGDREDSSPNGGSTAPTTNAGTPVPGPSNGKIKLVFNANALANGGSSGRQSDDE